ncbi:hypothetical protein [Peribacillus sp. SCS-37]|uniref:hypothetical protein n=1 Tax=Paraperibacillus esterisolvens TaxID=3115296 RepID=UPI003906698D
MNWKLTLAFILLLVASGCDKDLEVKQIEKKEYVETLKQNSPSFSYLNDLPNDKMKSYQLFINDHNISHLQEFSPEQIVLIYLHSISEGLDDDLYLLTYNGGSLPDPEVYKTEYDKYLSQRDKDMVFKYRNFDTIEKVEANEKADEKAVVIKVRFGIFSDGTVFPLKREEGIWKMDAYYILKYFKSKENKL